MRPRCLLVTLIMLLSAAGCANLKVKPEPSLPVAIPGQWTAAQTEATATPDRWWESFGDTTFNNLVDEVMSRNTQLEVTAARLDAAAGAARLAGAELYPSIGAGASAERGRSVIFGIPIPGQDVLSSTTTTYGVQLNTSWEADLWGRVRAGRNAALADFQTVVAGREALRSSLAGQAAKVWFRAIEAQLMRALAEQTVASYEETEQWVRGRYEQGLVPSLDLRQAMAAVASNRAAVEQQNLAVDAARRQLELLLGRYPSGELELRADFPAFPGPPPAGVPADVLDRRPDLRAARLRMLAAGLRVEEARASLYPRLSLTARGGTTSDDLARLLDGDYLLWTIAGNLVAPIFQGGRLRANVAIQNARQREEASSFASAALQAFTEVETALSADPYLASAEERVQEAVAATLAAEKVAQTVYRSGLGDYLRVLETQRQLLSVRGQEIALRGQRFQNRIDLHLALGGSLPAVSPPETAPASDVPRAQPVNTPAPPEP